MEFDQNPTESNQLFNFNFNFLKSSMKEHIMTHKIANTQYSESEVINPRDYLRDDSRVSDKFHWSFDTSNSSADSENVKLRQKISISLDLPIDDVSSQSLCEELLYSDKNNSTDDLRIVDCLQIKDDYEKVRNETSNDQANDNSSDNGLEDLCYLFNGFEDVFEINEDFSSSSLK